MKITRTSGSNIIKGKCLQRAAELNFTIHEKESDFSTKKNGVVTYTCKNINKYGGVCNNTHRKNVRAFLAFHSPHCPSCARGKGTTPATMKTEEEREARQILYASKLFVRSDEAQNISDGDGLTIEEGEKAGQVLDLGMLRKAASDP